MSTKIALRDILVCGAVLLLIGCTATPVQGPIQQPTVSHTQVTAHCHARGPLPDAVCTPGAIFQTATKAIVCVPGYAASVRAVPQSVKDAVYAEYGITTHAPGAFEIDHLISLELGGSNDIKNLWPEPYTGLHNAHDKDKVENMLHVSVCSGTITLTVAQQHIASNWMQ